MKKRIFTIGFAAVLLVLAAGAGGLYAYDSSRSDVIARGITAGGVDIGGLSAARARGGVERSLGPEPSQGRFLRWQGQGRELSAGGRDPGPGGNRMGRGRPCTRP